MLPRALPVFYKNVSLLSLLKRLRELSVQSSLQKFKPFTSSLPSVRCSFFETLEILLANLQAPPLADIADMKTLRKCRLRTRTARRFTPSPHDTSVATKAPSLSTSF